MLIRFVASFLKLLIASLVVGTLLSFIHITHADVLARIGMTPDQFVDMLLHALNWAIPKIGLGAFIVLPIWLISNLFRPPKGFD